MKVRLVFRYAAFCLLAMTVNLGLQFLAHRCLGAGFWLALVIGTTGGLILKYVLDRNFIFAAGGVNFATDAGRFSLYGCLGLITTAVFWLAEWLGHQWLPQSHGRYLGGALGLTLGYTLKYWMDRRWVFTPAAKAEQT
jgi:putative flippase GtrA